MLLHLRSWPSLPLSHLLGERSSLCQVACMVAGLDVFYVSDLAASAPLGRRRLEMQHMSLVPFCR